MNIVIVGGGFGGVKAALQLAKKKTNKITVISDKTTFQHYPTLFSTATGHSYKESWVPLERIFRSSTNVRLVHDQIVKVEPSELVISGASGKIYKYDKLVLALGSVTTYFGIEGLDTYAYGIKSEQEIRKLQSHLVKEMSDGSDDEKNYVIIGAGPTGVELAGALGEYIRQLRRHFGIKKKTVRISLIEAAPRVLPRMSENASKAALKRLKSIGLNVQLNMKVERQTADSLIVNGKPLSTQTVIWTSGVTNPDFYKQNQQHFTFNERGKVLVDEFMLTASGIYVIGDNAATPYAGLAQTALHDALFVAGHIAGKKKPYKAILPPSVVPIGHKWALFEWRKLRFGGWPGAVLRRAADLMSYRDILPLGWAIGVWHAGTMKQMIIPDDVSTDHN